MGPVNRRTPTKAKRYGTNVRKRPKAEDQRSSEPCTYFESPEDPYYLPSDAENGQVWYMVFILNQRHEGELLHSVRVLKYKVLSYPHAE